MSKIIGIDLGTTNSVVSVMEGGDPTVIPSAEGDHAVGSRFCQKRRAVGGADRPAAGGRQLG